MNMKRYVFQQNLFYFYECTFKTHSCVFEVLFRLSDIYRGLISWTFIAETAAQSDKG